MVGLLPGCVEGADAAGGAAADRAAVAVPADVVFRIDGFEQKFVAQKFGVAVGNGVVFHAANHVLRGARAAIGPGWSAGNGRGRARVIRRRVPNRFFKFLVDFRAFGDQTGLNKDGDHDRDFFLENQIVENVDDHAFGVALGVTGLLAILEDHKRRGSFRIVLGGDVDPIVALHAAVRFAGVD